LEAGADLFTGGCGRLAGPNDRAPAPVCSAELSPSAVNGPTCMHALNFHHRPPARLLLHLSALMSRRAPRRSTGPLQRMMNWPTTGMLCIHVDASITFYFA